MLLTLIIIVALIGAAVIGNIYSGFITFYTNFGEIENYNKAYYASIAALERAELVTKQRQPGYDGSGGWINDISSGSYNNGCSDGIIDNNFSYLSRDSGKDSTVFWEIKSSTSRIPREGLGDVDKTLITGDSINYNMMDYDSSEVFLLYYDSGHTNQYSEVNKLGVTKSTPNSISGKIRLPQYLYPTFGNLDKNNSLVVSSIKDDIIVDWQVLGKTNNNEQITIFSTQKTNNSGHPLSDDTTIRESDLDGDGFDFKFGDHRDQDPKVGANHGWTMVSSYTDGNTIEDFTDFFSNLNFNQIRFSLLNLLKNGNGLIYPYLEYYIQVDNGVIPDKYFNINAEGVYGDYKVNLTIHKPTNKESNLQSFTMILK